MPLSKKKNRERMREIRLHKQHLSPQESKPVQPKPLYTPLIDAISPSVRREGYGKASSTVEVDADGNIIPED